MIHKKRILLPIVCATLLAGCGEEFSAGVVKGGTGTGGKPPSGVDIVVERVPLKDSYSILLSKPKTDDCQGVKRTLQFLDPITLDVIEENQSLEVTPSDEVVNQLVLQVRWENQSEQPKTILHPSCHFLVELQELGDKVPVKALNCDLEEITTLEKNKVYVHQQMYQFDYTSKGVLKHSMSTQFLPLEASGQDCENLSIPYEIQNIEK